VVALRRLVRHLRPNVIHNAGMQACVLSAIANLGRRQLQIHAMTGLGYIFTSGGASTRTLVSELLRFLLNNKNCVVLVQNPDDQAALEKLGIVPEKFVLIPGSGVDTAALTPMPEPLGSIAVGFAGRLLSDKGIRALVEAHRRLRPQIDGIRLIIAGRTDAANPASIPDEEVESWRSEPGITLMGHISDIADLWRISHIAALPSHREGLPKSLLEAAACGRPMITTDAPGCREIVLAGETGLLVPVEDPDALVRAIAELAASPELRARFGTAARRLVEDKMSDKAIGAATVALYRRVTSASQILQPCPEPQ
jgi:glycosyltransferase involved in cell wall biosynthesis